MGSVPPLSPETALVLEGRRILIVEDLESIRKLVSRLLKSLGCDQVHVAANITGAQAKLDQLGFDVVLLDYNLSGENGLSLLQRLRRDTWQLNKGVPVIMLTGHGDPELIQDAVAIGADAFIVKPVMPDRLGQRILNVITKAKWQRPADKGPDTDPDDDEKVWL